MNEKQPPIVKFLLAGGILGFGKLLVLYTASVNDIHDEVL
jgi:hypothetical protein